MQLNVLDDLAEAMKALDGKKYLEHRIHPNMTPSPPQRRLTQLNNHRHLTKKPETYSPKQPKPGGGWTQHTEGSNSSIQVFACHGSSTRPTAPEGLWGLERTGHTQQRYQGCTQIPASTRTPCGPTTTHVELLHCDPWPLAKITMEDFSLLTSPFDTQSTRRPKYCTTPWGAERLTEMRVIEFFSEWQESSTSNACQARAGNQITPPLLHANEGLLVQRALPRP